MKKLFLSFALICALSCRPSMTVVWNEADIPSEEPAVSGDGTIEKGFGFERQGTYELLVCNPPEGLDWELWGYFMFRDLGPKIVPEYTDELSWERFDGKLCVMKPKLCRDTLRLRYRWGALPGFSWAPCKFVLRGPDGRQTSIPVKHNFLPASPDTLRTYARRKVSPTDIIPQLKSVTRQEGVTRIPADFEVIRTEGHCDGWYRITADGSLKVEAADPSGEVYARDVLKRISVNGDLHNVVIEDWPDVPFRVHMLSLASMHYPVSDLKRVIDIMSRYRMNILHLHLTDDSGWRIAIDGLPELTEYGAFHRLPVKNEAGDGYDERDALAPGRLGKEADGFYTHEEFVDIVRYAASRAVTIVPEVDLPAHSKASVRAMEIRARRTGDTTYLLTDPCDSSRTLSIQGYKRNTVNVAMPSTWRFIEKVVDQFVGMYAEAGTELKYFHIGGDEVPDGVWMGSPIAREFMEETGLSTKGELRGYFISRMLDLLKSKGIRACGWSSMTYNVPDSVRWKVRDEVAYLNCGQTVGDPKLEGKLYGLANDGIPCCVNCCGNTYLANAYSPSKYESGFYYAGYTDERRCFKMMPFRLFDDDRYVLERPDAIKGVGTLMWFSMQSDVEESFRCMYPKVLGIYERAWNARPAQPDFDKFYSIVAEKEIPWLDACGIPRRAALKGVGELAAEEPEYKWTGAQHFQVLGKITPDTYRPFSRLPESLRDGMREKLWNLGECSAGIAVRFSSDAGDFKARWTTIGRPVGDNMTYVVKAGMALYVLDKGEWVYVSSFRPGKYDADSVKEFRISCSKLKGEMREYMLYLGMYDGFKTVEIGVPEGSRIAMPAVNSPRAEYPVIAYGTSILQGASASHPGLAGTNLLGRILDRQVINLGFSGNALLDPEVAEYMASYPTPGAYIISNVGNCSADLVLGKEEEFYRILRDAHPGTPIFFVGLARSPLVRFDTKKEENYSERRDALLEVYEKLKKCGEKNIWYVSSDGILRDDNTGTVEGTHYTDLAFQRWAETLAKALKGKIKDSRPLKLSIIGDSISTFEEMVPEGNKVYRKYTRGACLGDWTCTYWGRLITKYQPGRLILEKNISVSGSCVAQDGRSGRRYRAGFVTRYGQGENNIGNPDIVIIHGGTNDRTLGIDSLSFARNYDKLVSMVRRDCPKVKIVCLVGDALSMSQKATIEAVAGAYPSVTTVDFSNGGEYNPLITKAAGCHPDKAGMDYMASAINDKLKELKWI